MSEILIGILAAVVLYGYGLWIIEEITENIKSHLDAKRDAEKEDSEL